MMEILSKSISFIVVVCLLLKINKKKNKCAKNPTPTQTKQTNLLPRGPAFAKGHRLEFCLQEHVKSLFRLFAAHAEKRLVIRKR